MLKSNEEKKILEQNLLKSNEEKQVLEQDLLNSNEENDKFSALVERKNGEIQSLQEKFEGSLKANEKLLRDVEKQAETTAEKEKMIHELEDKVRSLEKGVQVPFRENKSFPLPFFVFLILTLFRA